MYESANGHHAQLTEWLREQRKKAGITYAQMAERSTYSASALSRAASGKSLPQLSVVTAYAEACEADPSRAIELWQQARHQQARASGQAATWGRRPHPEYVRNYESLRRALIDLHLSTGAFSLREMELRTARKGNRIPHSTLHSVLRKQAIPSRAFVEAFVRSCGANEGSISAWCAAWDRANRKRLREARMAKRIPWKVPIRIRSFMYDLNRLISEYQEQGLYLETLEEACLTVMEELRHTQYAQNDSPSRNTPFDEGNDDISGGSSGADHLE
ncbi:helix-turn-helix domain-containing protein [Streptomyces scabiei]|uniref:helix-turn-helix domain-containing protein n=1 Tax=Streptomyces scabiei TaxID=1930 RepID=UPI0036E9C9FE